MSEESGKHNNSSVPKSCKNEIGTADEAVVQKKLVWVWGKPAPKGRSHPKKRERGGVKGGMASCPGQSHGNVRS